MSTWLQHCPKMVKHGSREASGRSLASLGPPGRPKSEFSAILELNWGSIWDAEINRNGVRIEAWIQHHFISACSAFLRLPGSLLAPNLGSFLDACLGFNRKLAARASWEAPGVHFGILWGLKIDPERGPRTSSFLHRFFDRCSNPPRGRALRTDPPDPRKPPPAETKRDLLHKRTWLQK